MSLKQEIEKAQQESMKQIPEDTLKTLIAATERLVQSGLTNKSLRKGDKAPSFTLPNAAGNPVNSSKLLNDGPLVVSFYRGGWCPYCNLELHALQQAFTQMKEFGAQLVAISPETPDHSLSTSEKHSLKFEVLSDVGNRVAREFGLVFVLAEELRPTYKEFGIDLPAFNGDDSYELPVPATYVIGSDGTIVYSFVNADYTQRAEPADIIDVLKDMNA
ncbi:MAG: peroxiredoxin-like family protein [bacterium]